MTPIWQKLTARLPTGLCILLAAIPIIFGRLATASTLRHLTITVPEGTSDHGNPRLLCTPAKWTDVATFILANFVAHAATVKTRPGEPAVSVFIALVCALFFPGFGTARGLDAIFRHAITGKSALQKAKQAGALCQVVRTSNWKPRSGDIVQDVRVIKNTSMDEWRSKTSGLELSDDLQLDDVSEARGQVSDRTENTAHGVPDTVDTHNSLTIELPSRIVHVDDFYLRSLMFEPSIHTKIHGICRLPHGFALAPVGITATIAELDEVRNYEESWTKTQPKTTAEVSSSYSLAQGLVAVFQTLYASATLYRARGDQIERYGYAAFGLTVAPYLVMSIVNLVSTILTPNYPTTFMVESEIMREAARRDGARFDGVVGVLQNHKSVRKATDMAFTIDEQGRCSVRQQRPPLHLQRMKTWPLESRKQWKSLLIH